MKATSRLAALAILLSLTPLAFAEGDGPYASHDAIITGSGAAAAGTNLYNTVMQPKNPLPVHGGDNAAIRQTLRNLGAGQELKEAWSNAAKSEAGAKQRSKAERDPDPSLRKP